MEEDYLRLKQISQKDERTLELRWIDNKVQTFDVVELRRQCPCASCIDEMTGKRILQPTDVSEDVRPLKIDSVGRYALNIHFNDGHKTGIYTFKSLRSQLPS